MNEDKQKIKFQRKSDNLYGNAYLYSFFKLSCI